MLDRSVHRPQRAGGSACVGGDLYDRSLPSQCGAAARPHLHHPDRTESASRCLPSAETTIRGSRVAPATGVLEKSGAVSGTVLPRLNGAALLFAPLLSSATRSCALPVASQTTAHGQRACFAALLAQRRPTDSPSANSLLLAHGFFICTDTPLLVCSGGETAVGTSDLSNLSPAEVFDYVALGHLHRPQTAPAVPGHGARLSAQICGG